MKHFTCIIAVNPPWPLRWVLSFSSVSRGVLWAPAGWGSLPVRCTLSSSWLRELPVDLQVLRARAGLGHQTSLHTDLQNGGGVAHGHRKLAGFKLDLLHVEAVWASYSLSVSQCSCLGNAGHICKLRATIECLLRGLWRLKDKMTLKYVVESP